MVTVSLSAGKRISAAQLLAASHAMTDIPIPEHISRRTDIPTLNPRQIFIAARPAFAGVKKYVYGLVQSHIGNTSTRMDGMNLPGGTKSEPPGFYILPKAIVLAHKTSGSRSRARARLGLWI
jgi:hypothetical protein